MSRAKRLGSERASTWQDLVVLKSTETLRRTWENLVLNPQQAGRQQASGQKLHPCFDPQIGLNVLARAALIRNVMKTEIRRDYRNQDTDLPDSAWQIGLGNQTHAYELFSERALGEKPDGWLHVNAPNTANLYHLNWRNKLCDGFLSGPYTVGGLNEWFDSRYASHLPGGRMTAHLLFETRFIGGAAIENYIRFLLHGQYVPSANSTLSCHEPYDAAELDRDHERRDKLESLLAALEALDNEGRPIITVSCKGNPAAGSRFATTLVARLRDRMRSACYIPLTKSGLQDRPNDPELQGKSNSHEPQGKLNDHGFRSVVEALHRFITGESSLECSPQEQGEAALAEMVRQVRSHLVKVPTVFVFDGFAPGVSAYPALISFIRDEPIERILRLLQHPETEDWTGETGQDIAVFRQTWFVVVGTPPENWMEMHRRSTLEIGFSDRDQIDLLNRSNMLALKEALGAAGSCSSSSARAESEWQLNALSFLARKVGVDLSVGYAQALEQSFKIYWQGLRPWQRLYLRALSLSESGLRWSTAGQIFEAYVRLSREVGASNAEYLAANSVGAEEFKKFIDEECRCETAAPLLFEYCDGPDADSYDIFDFPSQAISRVTDAHPWIMARHQKKGRWMQTVDFVDVAFKQLVKRVTTPGEAVVIRRILSELCLQAFRVRLRHARSARRIDRRAARNLAESLLHGVMSIEHPASGRKEKRALPQYTLGEIPADPEAAFSFLYGAVFTDLFCAGDPTNIARLHGNGELQLEMLLLMSGAMAVGGPERALAHPEKSVCSPPWWSSARSQRERFRHLLAIAGCAKRAGRAEVMDVALRRIEALHADPPLPNLDLLAFHKLAIDHALMVHDDSRQQRRAGVVLRRKVLRAVVACVQPRADASQLDRIARSLQHALLHLKRDVRRHVGEHLDIKLSSRDMADRVALAGESILKVLPARKLPQETLTVLTRMARAEAAAGDRDQRQGRMLHALTRHVSAIAIYWLFKALAVRLRKDSPGAMPRVGFSATAGYVRSVAKVTDLLTALDRGNHTQFRNRLLKTARGMLDTYTREQGMEKADHIAAQVLECTYVRTAAPSTIQLARIVRPELPTGDERLTSLSRCLQWLSAAEREMLSFSGQPGLRVMLCRERILCIVDMLNRVAEHVMDENRRRLPRKLNEGDGAAFRTLVDTLINDLRQYANFIAFMESYSPAGRFVIEEWTHGIHQLLMAVRASLAHWKARDAGQYNDALDLLQEVAAQNCVAE